MTLNRCSAGIKALMDAETGSLQKLVAVIQHLVVRPTRLVGYSGTPSTSMNEFTGGAKLFEIDCPAGTWDGLSYTGWSGMSNQTELLFTSLQSAAWTMVRIEDLAGRAYLAFDLSQTAPDDQVTDFEFQYPDGPALVAGTDYRIPPFAISWGYIPP